MSNPDISRNKTVFKLTGKTGDSAWPRSPRHCPTCGDVDRTVVVVINTRPNAWHCLSAILHWTCGHNRSIQHSRQEAASVKELCLSSMEFWEVLE
jgi:hypothetical protein